MNVPLLSRTLLVSALVFLVVFPAGARPLTRAEIGELFLFGIVGTEMSSALRSHLQSTCPGSILLFKRNLISTDQTKRFISDLRTAHKTCSTSGLFVGVDQEGGAVARIALDPPMPSPWAIGITRQPELAFKLGKSVGSILNHLGFNFNLAPVLDLGSSQHPTFIGSRAFGDSASLVASAGVSFSKGLVSSRVLPVAKHFPGIGSIANDPHVVMVRRPTSLQSLTREDLIPFVAFSSLSPSAVMPSHLIYPGADLSGRPGTYSQELLVKHLRHKIGFEGLVISDDLLMKGAQETADLNTSVVAALSAGNDVVLISWSKARQERALLAVQSALAAGTLSEASLREKVARVRKAKQQLLLSERPSATAEASELMTEYADVTSLILIENLKLQTLPNLRLLPKRVFVWPGDIRTRWQIERGLPLPTLSATDPDFLKIRSDDFIVAFVTSKTQLKKVLDWPAKIRRQTLLINQLEPYLPSKGFAGHWNVLLRHPMMGTEIAKRLQNIWSPSAVVSQYR